MYTEIFTASQETSNTFEPDKYLEIETADGLGVDITISAYEWPGGEQTLRYTLNFDQVRELRDALTKTLGE